MKYVIVTPQQVIGPMFGGVDYGGKMRVLIRRGTDLLVYRPPCKCWSSIGAPFHYVESQVMQIATSGYAPKHIPKSSGGRITQILARPEVKQYIVQNFGHEALAQMSPDTTLEMS